MTYYHHNNIMTEYTTDQLIDRVYTILEQNNVQRNTKLVMDSPEVMLVNGQTCFKNFTSICEKLKRNTSDVKKFFEDEMSTKTSIDGLGMLQIDGKFRTNNIEKVLLSYMQKYVFCNICSSANTKLDKKDRIQYIECLSCKSRRAL